MAKRTPADEKPYRPVDEALVRSVLNPSRAEEGELPAPITALAGTANGVRDERSNGTSRPADARIAAPHSSNAPPLPAAPVVAPRAGREPTPTEPPFVLSPVPEKLIREKRILVTPSEDWELERLVADMAIRLGTPLKLSHVLRATATLLCHAREALLQESQRVAPLKRPHNGDGAALCAFEHSLAQLVDASLRNTRPPSGPTGSR